MTAEPINFLYSQNQPGLEPTWRQEPPKRRTKKIVLFIILLGFLIIGGCIIRQINSNNIPEDPNQYDPITLEPKKPEGFIKKITNFVFNKENKLEGFKDDRINILLLGIGGLGHDGPFLTDTIIIASIKPSTGQIAMISIPRDLGVDIPGHGWNKINSASAFGEAKESGSGAEFTTKVIEDTFDIKIHYYTRVDFEAFREIIDEVGGVTINVENSFTDQMYPAPDYEYQTVQFYKGVQTMDGATALKYVRSRHGNNGEGSDFARARRQQKLLFALKEKLLSFGTILNPIKINNIKNSLEKHITTNMNFSDIMAFAKIIKDLDTSKIITTVLDDSPDNYLQNGYSAIGAFILKPKTGNFSDINEMIKNIFNTQTTVKNDTPVQTKPALSPANIEIQNGTWSVGMAMRMKKRLEDKNFIITTVGNTTEKPQASSGLYQVSNNSSTEVLQALQTELHIPIKQVLPTGIEATSTSDILILLGDDIQE